MRSPIRTTRLSVEALDDRIVPAAVRLDLTHHGALISAGVISMASRTGRRFFDFSRMPMV